MNQIIQGDCLEVLKTIPGATVDCCVTSPPYWGLRNYNNDSQLGLEKTPEEYVENMVKVFREVKRVLKAEGTLWVNLGDSYATNHKTGSNEGKHGQISKSYQCRAGGVGNGRKPKDLVGIPWMVAFALRSDGWYLRQDIIWHKPNPMPESVKDRCTKNHEYFFMLSKSQNYYYDNEAIKTVSIDPEDDRGLRKNKKRIPTAMINGIRNSGVYPMANKRSVWTVATKPFNEAHFATYPPELIEDCILAGCPIGGVVLDPFFGAGTTGLVAMRQKKSYIGIELNPEYIEIAKNRLNGELFKDTI